VTAYVYTRTYYPVRIEALPEGGAEVSVAGVVRVRLADADLQPTRRPDAPLLRLTQAELNAYFAGVQPATYPWVRGVAVTATDERLAALPWEEWIETDAAHWYRWVRSSPVPPTIAGATFNLPLRIVEVGPGGVAQAVAAVFGTHDPAHVAKAVTVTPCGVEELDELAGRQLTADVLHFNDGAFLADGADLLRCGRPDRRGTLGWLLRLVDRLQTRLVVLTAPARAHDARRLAAAVVARGGPAVRVSREPELGAYPRLVHDYPLDEAFEEHAPGFALFVGAGREELLRVSQPGTRLIAELQRGYPYRDAVRDELERFGDDWRGYQFDIHERDGLLPMVDALQRIRDVRDAGPLPLPKAPAPPPPPRWLNGAIHLDAPGLPRAPQDRPPLREGQVAHLGLDIGPRDTIASLDDVPLLEDHFRWTPETAGVWVELAVTGIDCEILGAPVRQLWLPRAAPSDRIYFAIRPRAERPLPGAARLRYCLYHENHLVQSWLLAALIDRRDGDAADLARALGATGDRAARLAGLSWASALEYAGTAGLEAVARPRRELSVLANKSLGERRLSIKGTDFFAEVAILDAGGPVTAARRGLYAASVEENKDVDSSLWTSAYDGGPDPARLARDLIELAYKGWQLCTTVVPNETQREALLANLPEGGRLKFVHLDLGESIPWGLVYDRPFDRKLGAVNGRPVAVEACLAALPGADGTPSKVRCGDAPCLLHESVRQQRLVDGLDDVDPRTVACPLHFWGFRHIVEVPVVQDSETSAAAPEPDVTGGVGAGPALAVGYDPVLPLVDEHVKGIKAPSAAMKTVRDDVIDLLGSDAHDVVYFFCHARRSRDPADDGAPQLLFAANRKGFVEVTAAELASPAWKRRPLVFLNGCATGAFDPTLLSPFVKTLMVSRRASAVIGTEIRIFTSLARRVADEFFRRFLTGAPAGESLLAARRALLAEHNPLGLAYTLYGVSELHLAPVKAP
jgi:CHAT domain-containing protein